MLKKVLLVLLVCIGITLYSENKVVTHSIESLDSKYMAARGIVSFQITMPTDWVFRTSTIDNMEGHKVAEIVISERVNQEKFKIDYSSYEGDDPRISDLILYEEYNTSEYSGHLIIDKLDTYSRLLKKRVEQYSMGFYLYKDDYTLFIRFYSFDQYIDELELYKKVVNSIEF